MWRGAARDYSYALGYCVSVVRCPLGGGAAGARDESEDLLHVVYMHEDWHPRRKVRSAFDSWEALERGADMLSNPRHEFIARHRVPRLTAAAQGAARELEMLLALEDHERGKEGLLAVLERETLVSYMQPRPGSFRAGMPRELRAGDAMSGSRTLLMARAAPQKKPRRGPCDAHRGPLPRATLPLR